MAGQATQDDVYDVVAGPVVDRVLDGFNGAVLAYGQTGTGKSHTMGILSRVESESAGLIPRALSHCFGHAARHPDSAFSVSVQFLQVYLEAVYDLLPPAGDDSLRPLAVRESPGRGFYAPDAGEWTVNGYAEAVAAINDGLERRVLGATRMNATSSRSHTLLMVTVRQARAAGGPATMGRLTLVDLAGSERVARTSSTGARLDEARAINSSLAALGNVIAKLSDVARFRGKASERHVPFRDSKLTKLLSRSLGGNAETCVVATIGPMAVDASETVSTLKFAERCMRVAAAPVRTVTALAAGSAQAQGMAEEAARRAVAEAESRWRQQAERLRQEYEARLAAVMSASAVGHNMELARKASGLAERIISALQVERPLGKQKGGAVDFDGVSSMLDTAARAIEPLLRRGAGAGTGASSGPAGEEWSADSMAGSGGGQQQLVRAADGAAESEEGIHQTLLLRYLLETNAKLMGGGGAQDGSTAWEASSDGSELSDGSPQPDRIVAHRVDEQGRLQYRLRWEGDAPESDEWFDAAALAEEFPDIVRAYQRGRTS
ncbi:hypothetical protein FNF29_04526 [Cafeteria roenbergensis]|uniref:Kinesin-like protein n=1 Tax=Cafeteria roenbergensis TaxID=33653 RepID=A0A5A8CF31_CAFRO|nr:hypothetical protein FNF29_04526 [Cafeteria roenbergensis]|eukprot:KAA0151602.1 hypothetical protein FNF29_04526 [Cafeteria roenbergensis]